MRIVDIIEKKRDGRDLTTDEITWFIHELTADRVPDYQTAALLMAIFLRGMSRRETVDLTLAMARSGDQLDLHDVAPFVVDKHSSGGVGDKTTLVVQPLVAACGVPVGKMSGRGLGSSGGTLDKMESLSGWRHDLTLAQFKRQLAEIGLVLAGQTAVLAPADGKLYALRDVTGTVASTPLIAASIMSKKLAAGADAIVLDVKMGSGAFMPTVESARELARIMVDIGADAGRQTVALISDMNQPLGHAIGNALEVNEAIATLQGDGPADFWAHCLEVAAHMLLLAGKTPDLETAKTMVTQVRNDGRALSKFRELVTMQGGDGRQVDNPDLLPAARLIEPILAPQSGTIAAMDTAAIGWAAVHLGGGRLVKSDVIDHAVGFILRAKVGDRFAAGERLGEIHANDAAKLTQAQQELLAAIQWTGEAVRPLPHFYGTVS
ncbi:MAG: thymidine phosphorylase [Chloroflexi bacterium]|nr:thymidine phosphorylase [Ardenticatenaceae bacterium]MBL1127583.1 thymidine phosphorylase [Chloroflexota bacterium]NOG33648.1 thymidine phosphorylase [Chloroflexota bacterium]GIK56606.1 MAG: thymidine phosphorylase [Chloroflexota bacterium]